MEDVLSFVDWRTHRLYYNSVMFNPNQHNMVNGELVERADYKKNILNAELKGLKSQKAYLEGQLNTFADKLMTLNDNIGLKENAIEKL